MFFGPPSFPAYPSTAARSIRLPLRLPRCFSFSRRRPHSLLSFVFLAGVPSKISRDFLPKSRSALYHDAGEYLMRRERKTHRKPREERRFRESRPTRLTENFSQTLGRQSPPCEATTTRHAAAAAVSPKFAVGVTSDRSKTTEPPAITYRVARLEFQNCTLRYDYREGMITRRIKSVLWFGCY